MAHVYGCKWLSRRDRCKAWCNDIYIVSCFCLRQPTVLMLTYYWLVIFPSHLAPFVCSLDKLHLLHLLRTPGIDSSLNIGAALGTVESSYNLIVSLHAVEKPIRWVLLTARLYSYYRKTYCVQARPRYMLCSVGSAPIRPIPTPKLGLDEMGRHRSVTAAVSVRFCHTGTLRQTVKALSSGRVGCEKFYHAV